MTLRLENCHGISQCWDGSAEIETLSMLLLPYQQTVNKLTTKYCASFTRGALAFHLWTIYYNYNSIQIYLIKTMHLHIHAFLPLPFHP